MKYLALGLFLWASSVFAGVEYRQFSNDDQRETYENLISELRCLVCQNQNIADSNADLAADLRQQVYQMVQQGKTKQDIKNFMTDRYGDFVLYNPPFKTKTGLLWLAPVLLLALGLISVFVYIRNKRKQLPEPMEPEQLQKIHRLLEEDDRL
ncbi:MAG: cytochrome C biogenesis protein CcmH [Methylobacter sp.]|nr:MAG: cytochrome C biogenesis protein CcmH [Methylobacter sp.]PPD05021.1 MAG: cytochrome C biogenesis protein CcmH [Methylobacter sp.]PPD21104.1 MAG: cytochrome C biogenesis protein CcmH [Methylobacter sp.]PPD32016.1 MAG: cytochrome C biogenesis protein CcmH [Methylomonas sp.]